MIQAQEIKLKDLHPNKGQIEGVPTNPRRATKDQIDKLKRSIEETPTMLQLREIIAYDNNGELVIVGGNMRYEALKSLGYKTAYVKILPADTPKETINAFIIKDNAQFGEWDIDLLANDWDKDMLEEWGVDVDRGVRDISVSDTDKNEAEGGKLQDKFGIPPFSIFDTRSGVWRDRKKVWREFIGSRGETREGALSGSLIMRFPGVYKKCADRAKEKGITLEEYFEKYISEEEKDKLASATYGKGVSLFDPVVSEICSRWFTPHKGAKIFDCFAGDCQKGLVFDYLGFEFTGIELRPEQVEENRRIIAEKGNKAQYICDDGRNVRKHIVDNSQDLLFSCPPYFDLEVYSDRPDDASNQKDYASFIAILREAFQEALKCLKDDRFIVIVVGDIRSKKGGHYYDFCGDIKRIFIDSGAKLWNEIILVEAVGSACLRTKAPMRTRKVVKTHQNILVFYKGDSGNIKANFEELDFRDIEEVYSGDDVI